MRPLGETPSHAKPQRVLGSARPPQSRLVHARDRRPLLAALWTQALELHELSAGKCRLAALEMKLPEMLARAAMIGIDASAYS